MKPKVFLTAKDEKENKDTKIVSNKAYETANHIAKTYRDILMDMSGRNDELQVLLRKSSELDIKTSALAKRSGKKRKEMVYKYYKYVIYLVFIILVIFAFSGIYALGKR
ncbi:hypothetical protein CWI38_1001p0010 [Hamiltosporidium tvaerminnensis]|uniref:V-SNARE coiled-coil homology domain-containing protein n=2 Tax=Hamiltosporidium TaxID=1176354 RepID=A0A4Q9LTD3_9MICR|nr:hypothetical protein CWI37_2092p0010 [Hamiltosporidium tvaerminnensis]TBU06599.1 hypothetical protein CWI36_0415p0020 [Hamiltosporidium magnivora]TBU11118.1 hypothetical protein CWI38_1375p0010 [Hamiltosporidium tvaerminnensis]TBU11873.1 hypothetical protein CWI38_1001p0010 [Hamiltosporidium tvaerminnensis]